MRGYGCRSNAPRSHFGLRICRTWQGALINRQWFTVCISVLRQPLPRDHQSPSPPVVRKMVPLQPTAVPVFASVNDTPKSHSVVPLFCATHVAPRPLSAR